MGLCLSVCLGGRPRGPVDDPGAAQDRLAQVSGDYGRSIVLEVRGRAGSPCDLGQVPSPPRISRPHL